MTDSPDMMKGFLDELFYPQPSPKSLLDSAAVTEKEAELEYRLGQRSTPWEDE